MGGLNKGGHQDLSRGRARGGRLCALSGQVGLKHRSVKPLRGLGGNVLEVISRHDGDTFRVVSTVRSKTVVYVLHVFQKKAKRGIATPASQIDLIRGRLRAAEQHYRQNHGGG